MAIQNSKTLASGITGNYWKITKLTIDIVALTTTIEISLYLDSTHGNDGVSKPIYHKTYSTNVTLTQIMSGSVSNLYVNLLAKANTTVSIDILGNTLSSPRAFDSDIAGGTIVA